MLTERSLSSARAAITSLLVILVIGATGSVAASPAPTPGPPPATLADGVARLQAGDPAEAAKIFEGVAERDPNNVRLWRLLGVASLQAKNLDRAETAFRKSLELDPGSPLAMYNMGVVLAARGKPDAAFEFLRKARASRKFDMTYAGVDPDLESLRHDPRFAELLPTAQDFAQPFVEPVKIIREWDGESANDQFGWIARSLGDVDGDGVNDVVTSAPTSAAAGDKAGRVYVYSTKTGALLWKVDGKTGDQLGTGVECAGDVNRDGVPDVVAGAPNGGKAFVFSGKDGSVLHSFLAESQTDNFGTHVSGVGDVDGDGYADVMVGAPANNAGGKGAGRAYVYSGKDGHRLLTLTGERAGDAFGSTVGGALSGTQRFLLVGAPGAGPRKTGRTYVYAGLSPKPRFVNESDETGRALGGMFVSVAGDLDGDGVPDIYASDFSNAAKGPSTGRVYVHSGKTGRRLLTLTGSTPGEGFGIGPATAGDVDGDGRADLIVGAWQYAGAALSGGRAYLYSGRDGRLLRTYTCRVPGDTFGFDAVGMGDVDGDGMIDFLITSAWSGVHGYHSGRMFVISSDVPRKKS